MKTLRITIAVLTLAALGFAQKEAPMPKDLPRMDPSGRYKRRQ
jgi:hypothetical protein